jgi:UDP-glucose 4-epimerase
MTAAPTLVVGSGGLLGSALVRRLRRENRAVLTARVPWSVPDAVRAALADAVDRLLTTADGGDWSVAWCAGAAVTGATPPVLEAELATLRGFLTDLVDRAAGAGRGRLFYASSAGGVYGGSVHPPFDESSAPRPLGPYGVAKLEAEQAVRTIAGDGGVDVVVGRIANLYGPGQDLAKPQGLISQLCRSHVVGQPLNLYVPLDTIRDYLYVDDCAAMVGDALTLPEGRGAVTVKVMASQRPATIGAVLGECRRVFGRRPRVVLGSSPVARQQARDLRLRSLVLPALDARATTTLSAGIHRTLVSVTGALHAASGQGVRAARSGAA